MQIGPEHAPIDVLDGLEQMMVVVPVDAEEYKTQHVAEKDWRQREQELGRERSQFRCRPLYGRGRIGTLKTALCPTRARRTRSVLGALRFSDRIEYFNPLALHLD